MGNGKTEYTEEAKRIHAMNKVIAEFDGYRTYSKTYGRNHGIGGGMLDIPKECIIEKLKYHSSFDAIAPIIYRLESVTDTNIMFYITKGFCGCVHDWVDTSTEEFKNFKNTSIDYKYSSFNGARILAIHQAVYDCIVWYNELRQSKENV